MSLKSRTPSWEGTSLRLPRGRQYDPYLHAEALGIRVAFSEIDEPEVWLPDESTIIVNSRLRPAQQREVCAHGVGHAALGHEDDRPKHEHQADLYSSLYLIDPRELRALTREGRDIGWICNELGLTRQLVEVYLQWLSR